MDSIAVIGAGITGLTAAFRLRQRGLPVTLYEASGRVGGVIQSIQQDGYLAEFGPNTILETSPKIADLIRDVGLENERLYSDPAASNRYIVRGRRPVTVPGSPIGFFTTPLFSLSAKLRLLREPFIPPGPQDREENLAEFVVRRIGQEFLDYAINPFVAGVYAGDPARLSVQHAFPKLLAVEHQYGSLIKGQILGARERKRRGEVSKQNAPKLSFRQGLQALIEALQRPLQDALRLNHPVRRIEQTADGWRVHAGPTGSETATAHAAVLLVAPAYKLAELELITPAGVDLTPLAAIRYPPVVSVVLGFRREDVAHPLNGFGMLVPQVEGLRILGSIFSSSLFPHRAPPGHVTLTSYVGGTRAPELTELSPDRIVDLTLQDLRELLGIRGQPTFHHQVLYPRAIPQYEVGYGRFKDVMSSAEQRAPGLFFAGHYREGISLGDSIVSGHAVVDRLAASLAPSRP